MNDKQKNEALLTHLDHVHSFAERFTVQIEKIGNEHKLSGGHLEFAYIEHFHKEITGLSDLFQYLVKDASQERYVFFAVRGSIEILLHLEYVLRLAREGDSKVFELLSKDLAQSAAAAQAAAPSEHEDALSRGVKALSTMNRLLETGSDIDAIKSNTKIFPDMRTLCSQSRLNLKDAKGADMYHVYALYSESNHLRLSSQHAITSDVGVLTNWALQYFIEIYIKFYQQILETDKFDAIFGDELAKLKRDIGISW
jgi:hypothetical protein